LFADFVVAELVSLFNCVMGKQLYKVKMGYFICRCFGMGFAKE
jgi:hypothetical protein